TLLLMPWGYFTGFYTPHLPNSFLKSPYKPVWEKEKEIFHLKRTNKLKEKNDVTKNIFKFCKLGFIKFVKRGNIGRNFILGNNDQKAILAILKQKHRLICLNDSDDITNFKQLKKDIIASFEKILPNRSQFERYI